MKLPNWQHHSKKEKKRHLKPQALRQARKRRGQLLNRLLNPSKRRVSYYNGYINKTCLLYTSPSPRDKRQSRMPSSA